MKRLLCIIPASLLDTVRELTVQHFGYTAEQAAAAWTPMGSPTGKAPATHWWLSAQFTAEGAALAEVLAAQPPGAQVLEYDFATQPAFPDQQREALQLMPL